MSTKEMVGRRVFTSKLYVKEGHYHYKVDIFLDDRLHEGLSVDRLGIRKADDEVITFLGPLAEKLGETRNKPFRGWAQFLVSDVTILSINPTEADGEDNPYHAEVNRDECINQDQLYLIAFMLAVKAKQHAFIQYANQPEFC